MYTSADAGHLLRRAIILLTLLFLAACGRTITGPRQAEDGHGTLRADGSCTYTHVLYGPDGIVIRMVASYAPDHPYCQSLRR